jgi:hypothetical protein
MNGGRNPIPGREGSTSRSSHRLNLVEIVKSEAAKISDTI